MIPGDVVYRLYDTFGFPVDITDEMAREDGLLLDMAGFEKALGEQKERSEDRPADERPGRLRLGESVGVVGAAMTNVFTGYETLESDATILAILKDGQSVEEIGEGEEAQVFFDVTPFYGEAGGQVSDDGVVEQDDGRRRRQRRDAREGEPFLPCGEGGERHASGRGDAVRLSVDREKRRAVARNHTATHLLQFALRQVLGDHVKQSGSLVERDRLRFDFTHFQGLDAPRARQGRGHRQREDPRHGRGEDRDEEQGRGDPGRGHRPFRREIRRDRPGRVDRRFQQGAVRRHARQKYGRDRSFSIVSEGSLASGIRRIEAVTGMGAVATGGGSRARRGP